MTIFVPLYGAMAASQRFSASASRLSKSAYRCAKYARVGRDQLRQLLLDGLRDAAAVAGIQPVVRVALRVDVAHRARDLARSESRGSARSARRPDSRVAPGWILAFRLCVKSGGSQPISSSRPTSDEQVGALWSFRMKLGLGSTKCGSWYPRARASTVTLSPPTSLRQRRQVFGRRDHLQRPRRQSPAREQDSCARHRPKQLFHHVLRTSQTG